ncbi:MAG: PilW family protein [Deltaproteobacteria bacterium]|nr:MAG: PilW family protein [Deltaproteobacteria bacterium]
MDDFRRTKRFIDTRGFTLVEILVTLAIAALVTAAIYNLFIKQNRTYIVQDEVAEMQQNLRAAIDIMVNELRMAGLDPSGNAESAIVSVGGNSVNFTADLTGGESDGIDNDGDGYTDEPDETFDGVLSIPGDDITYSLVGGNLRRDDGTGAQILVENIEALSFAYAYDNDNDGLLDTAGGNVIWAVDKDNDNDLDHNLDTDTDGDIDVDDNPAGTALPADVMLDRIMAVRIWLLARTGMEDTEFTDPDTYLVAGQAPYAPNDGYRRRLLTATVKFRNLGL